MHIRYEGFSNTFVLSKKNRLIRHFSLKNLIFLILINELGSIKPGMNLVFALNLGVLGGIWHRFLGVEHLF